MNIKDDKSGIIIPFISGPICDEDGLEFEFSTEGIITKLGETVFLGIDEIVFSQVGCEMFPDLHVWIDQVFKQKVKELKSNMEKEGRSEKERDGFTKVANALISTNKLDIYQKSCILNIISNKEDFKMSLKQLAQRIPCSRDKANKITKSLNELGIVIVKKSRTIHGDWDTNSYSINFEKINDLLGVDVKKYYVDSNKDDVVVEKDNSSIQESLQVVVEKDNSSTSQSVEVVVKNDTKNTIENTNKEVLNKITITEDGCCGDITDIYLEDRGFKNLSKINKDNIRNFIKEYGEGEVKIAIDIANRNNKSNIGYLEGILTKRRNGSSGEESKFTSGMKELYKEAEKYDNSSLNTKANNKNSFNNFEPGNYDYKEIENKLLGWD